MGQPSWGGRAGWADKTSQAPAKDCVQHCLPGFGTKESWPPGSGSDKRPRPGGEGGGLARQLGSLSQDQAVISRVPRA